MKVRAFAAAALTLLAVLLASAPALAHKPSDTYVTLELVGGRGHGRVDLAVRDLDHAIGLDEDGDGLVTWREVEARREAVAALVRRGLVVTAPGGPCPIAIDPARLALATHTDGPYVVVPVGLVCASEAAPSAIRYELFFDVDPQNRGLFRLDRGGASRTHVFTAAARELPLDEAPRGAPLAAQLAVLVREGVRHIWTGYDHVLFLLALLLPSVLRRERGGWAPVSALRPALADVLRIVSAFTVAHSMTLGLSAANVLTLPSRLVESAIAASVALGAAEKLRPTLREERWVAAFALGLLHGGAPWHTVAARSCSGARRSSSSPRAGSSSVPSAPECPNEATGRRARA